MADTNTNQAYALDVDLADADAAEIEMMIQEGSAEVQEYDIIANFPDPGTPGVIYIEQSGNTMWRYDVKTESYVKIGAIYTHPTYTARTGYPRANATPGFGETVTVSQINSDATGHVTAATSRTIKIPDAEASSTAHGLMSAADKTKLDSVTPDEYAPRANPVFTESISMGRLADSIVGANSVAEGQKVEAMAPASHAEGYRTHARGIYSHAEGNSSETSGSASHAEGGNTKAVGVYAHAEGSSTEANGNDSHAEGNSTQASGDAAHAEGMGTIAATDDQHVAGKYNIADKNIVEWVAGTEYEVGDICATDLNDKEPVYKDGELTLAVYRCVRTGYPITVPTTHATEIDPDDWVTIIRSWEITNWEKLPYRVIKSSTGNYGGVYAEIIGNGTGINNRANARVLDWDGNETLAGKLILGAGPTEDMDAATKKYVDDSTASVSSIATEFSETSAYSLGTYVYKDGQLYRFITAHAAGAWNAEEVEEVTVGGGLANNNRMMTVYAQNIAGLEQSVAGTYSASEEAVDIASGANAKSAATEARLDEMDKYLEFVGRKQVNTPNLIKQNWWTMSSGLGRNVVYGRASRCSGTSCPYLTSYSDPTRYELDAPATAEQLAEACSYYVYTDGNGTHYYLFKDEDDFRASVVDLDADNQITEWDDEVYNKAIQMDITANSAYGNMEWLLYNYAYGQDTYKQGQNRKAYGQLEFMEPGKKYTLSFWARVTSGTAVNAAFGWGGTYSNSIYNLASGTQKRSDDFEIKGSEWRRYYWTFTFNPPGDWYTETTEEIAATETEEAYTKVTRIYNWTKRVGFGVGRKYTATMQMCGFRLTAGGLYHNTEYDELCEKIETLTNRINELEALVLES